MQIKQIGLWIKAVRAPFFTATIVPVVLGATLAWHDNSRLNWQKFLLTFIGVAFIHAGTNLVNDYFDHLSGCDEINKNCTPFSGGSRVIQEKQISAKNIFLAAITCFILGSAIGLYLNYLSGSYVVLRLGVVGVFLGFFYTVKFFRIVYGGFGELAVGIGCGLLIVAGTYYVQLEQLPLRVLLVSLPISILVAMILFINEFPDYLADKAVGKKTLVVILGQQRAMTLYHALLASTYLSIIFLVLFKYLPFFCLITLFSLPLALASFDVSRKNFQKIQELLPANALTIGLHSLVGLLLCAGLAMDKIFVVK